MAAGDITIKDQNSLMGRGARLCNVAAAATAIYAGEPVRRTVGAVTVTIGATNEPAVSAVAGVEGYFVGVAATNGTQTATAAGTVNVNPVSSGTIYLIAPNVATTWNTQAKYDALVGKRVLLDLTAGVYTILAADGANNGCTIEPLDIFKYPGKVAFTFRQGTSDVI